ncbi:hypothetical protein WJX72_010972 [[Myrmecia] bisecta]|uniref:DUF4476 domain-containing protein n=1 Tax=[Myrmecia] bisecta TaxID=41462 RepID=A0AAW1QA83_9CHLO
MKEARRLKHKLLGTPLHMASCHSRTKHVGQWTKLRRRVSGMNPAQLSMLGKSGEAAGKASNGASPPGTRRTTGTFPRTSDNGASRARRASLTGPPQKGSPDRRKTHGSDDGAAARTFAKGRRASGMAQLGLAAADGADPVPPDSARLKTSFAVPESPKASQTPGAREASPKHARAQPDWGETFLQASADPNAGACQLDVREFADLQLHAATIRVEHEGGSVYEQKCRELGVAALSSVISSLEAEHANLSHCYLGARGAHALAHALACNVVIRNLTLVGNHMDGQAVGHVVRGLMAGAGNIHTLEYSEKARVQNRVHKLPTSVARTSSVVPAHDDMAKRLRERHERSTSCITQLNISENALGSVGARYVADLINPQVCRMQQITVLKLSKCELGDAGGTALANALADNNVTLVDLDLSKNGLGNGTAAAFGPLLVHNQTLERLDLSWNTIKAAGARELAKGLESNANLLYLCLAWNGLEDEGCIHVAQMFHRNVGLKEVDLSRTRMGPAACIVLAEALKDNTTLTHLMLHGNPLGEAGGWHIMSALSNNHYLEYVGLQGANFVGTDSENQGSSAVANFNPAHPEGSYTLDMGMPAERAIAVMLCNLDATSPGDLLKNIRVNGKPVSGGAKKLGWPEKLPVSGNVALDFTMVKHRREVAVIDKQRLKIFTSNLAKQRTSDNERLAMVSIFAPYNYFTCAQCDDVLRTFGMGDEKIMAALVFFARAVDHAAIDDLTSSFYERELQKFYAHLGILAAFRPENPTAHYELSLTLPHHRNIAQRLADVAAAEGEALTWRNLTWEDHGSHANAGPPDEWRGVIPNKGLLQFDYTTSVRVSPDARVLPDEELHQVLATDVGLDVTAAKPGVILPRRSPVGGTSRSSADSGFSPADTVLCNLRILSTKVCISVLQLKGILGAIKASQDRVEALVTLYPRLVDPDELWVALYSLKGLEQSLAMSRLGLKATFNPKRCSLHFQLDVSNPEHLEVAKKLVDMAMKVPDQRNFWNIRIFGKVKFIPENNTMWAVMTTGSFTPYLEFDFLGPDAFELMGFTDERVGNMQPSEKTDILGKYAAKLEDTRLKQMHPYYGLEQQEVGSAAYATQPLASVLSSPMEQLAPLDGHSTLRRSTTLTRPGQAPDAASQKTPWAAVWERNMRRLIGLDGSLVSPLHEIFNTYAEDQRRMSTEQLRAALLAHGHNKSEERKDN